MKKATIVILVLLLLTGCWDRLPLRNINLVDIASIDYDEENGDILLQYVVTKLKNVGQGGGEPVSEITELKGPSLVEAVGQGEYVSPVPFLGVNTRIYVLSKSFASHNPVPKLSFLLEAPYTAINTPIVIFDGNISKFLKSSLDNKRESTKNLNNFISSLEKNGVMTNVSIMHFIQSQQDPLEDIALPLLKQSKSNVELSGALLFRQGTNTGEELSDEQVQMILLLLGKNLGRQKLYGHLSERKNYYGMYVRNVDSKINVSSETNGLPKIKVDVRLQLDSMEAGEPVKILNSDVVKRLEKEISNHLEESSVTTIETLQKANCDLLGIGKQIKAYHPNIWKSLSWRKDYPRLTIVPSFDVKILNTEEK